MHFLLTLLRNIPSMTISLKTFPVSLEDKLVIFHERTHFNEHERSCRCQIFFKGKQSCFLTNSFFLLKLPVVSSLLIVNAWISLSEKSMFYSNLKQKMSKK